jgi:predicted amidophosphoribosyltransferase
VADAFDSTPEGASLRAALPTLRRSVGLCARCGRPYNGIADACPACLATTSFPSYVPPATFPHDNGETIQPSGSSTTEEIEWEPE